MRFFTRAQFLTHRVFNSKQREKLEHVIQVWKDRAVFPPNVLSKISRASTSKSPSKPPPSKPAAKAGQAGTGLNGMMSQHVRELEEMLKTFRQTSAADEMIGNKVSGCHSVPSPALPT